MLYRIEIENFYSIRDQQTLDLTVDGKVPDTEGRYAPIFKGSEKRAPKVLAFYGPNASGKTTVLRAVEFVITMVRDSVQWSGSGFVGCERFNDAESANRPMRIAIELGGVMNASPEEMERSRAGEPVEHGVYRYELEIAFKSGVPTHIAAEALRQRPNDQGRWQRLYERNADGHVKDSKLFSLSKFQHLLGTLAKNHTVLSSFAKFRHPTATVFVEAAKRALFLIDPVVTNDDAGVINYLKTQPAVMARLKEELGRIDVGVEDARFQDGPNGPNIFFKHAGLEFEMPWLYESHGTRSFIRMYPFLFTVLDNGGFTAIDEMDAAIHPSILPEMVRWFYDSGERNKWNAQLWLSCHSVSLMESLRKEELVICEKDQQGRTNFHSLMDVKVRRDENHYRKYLSGAYGGIPNIG